MAKLKKSRSSISSNFSIKGWRNQKGFKICTKSFRINRRKRSKIQNGFKPNGFS